MAEPGFIELNGKTYQVVTVDFETFYDTDYTLSGKINMSEYVRDERFFVHGAAVKIGEAPSKWYNGKQLKKVFGSIDWNNSALLGHNVAFDGFICAEHFNFIPGLYLDTLSMARGVHGHHTKHNLDTIAKLHGREGKVRVAALSNTKGKTQLTKEEDKALGEYSCDDAEDTYHIFWKMYESMPDEELELVDLTIRMFCDPVLHVDIPRVQEELNKELGSKVAALLKSGLTAEDLLSNNKFAKALEASGITEMPKKVSPATGKVTYAFAKSDLAFQSLMNSGNERIKALCEARLAIKSTIGETRAVRFLEAGKNGQKLPILLNYAGAHTLRWSGGNKMNLQNLKRGGELRKSILAPPGHSVVVADSAQIEARVVAWLAGQKNILEAFRKKEDVYKMMASAIYNVPVESVTKDQRFIGKICVLGLGFGMGHMKFQVTLEQGTMGPSMKIELSEARRIVNLYRSRNPAIVDFWKQMDDVITNMSLGFEGTIGPVSYGKNYIRLPNGLFLQYYGLTSEIQESSRGLIHREATYLTRYGKAKLYGGLLTENVVQALARCIVAEQMRTIAKKYRVVTMTHDEIVCVVPTEQADECLNYMLSVMSTAPDWAPDLPLAAAGGHDVCYSK